MFTRAVEARERFVQWLQGRPKTRWLLAGLIYGIGFAAMEVMTDGGSLSSNAVAGIWFGVVMATVDALFHTKGEW